MNGVNAVLNLVNNRNIDSEFTTLFQSKYAKIDGNYHTPQSKSTILGSFLMDNVWELDV